jgi:hypothetical protein
MSWLWRMRGVQVLGAPAGDLALAAVLAAFGVADTVLTGQFQWLDQWRGPRLVTASWCRPRRCCSAGGAGTR